MTERSQTVVPTEDGRIDILAGAPPVLKMVRALRVAEVVLERNVESCLDCNYGDGPTGKASEGGTCEFCADDREALILVREALK